MPCPGLQQTPSMHPGDEWSVLREAEILREVPVQTLDQHCQPPFPTDPKGITAKDPFCQLLVLLFSVLLFSLSSCFIHPGALDDVPSLSNLCSA